MITVIAMMTAKSGKKEQALALARKNLDKVRAEQGCREYRLVDDVADMGALQTLLGEDTFAFIEGWDSMEALGKHLATPHMKAYFATTEALLADKKIHVLKSAD